MIIITRTPFRVSFFGGGTDFPQWYKKHGGAVLSTSIDKYCYVTCRRLPPFFDFKHRIAYSKQEYVNEIDEINNPVVREVFRFMDVKRGLAIHHDGDLPSMTGLASSSAFTVGLLHAIYASRGIIVTKKRLALECIKIEQEMINENIGSQDQIATAFGGLNKIIFSRDDNIEVNPVTIKRERINELEDSLALFFTGFTRIASEIEGEKINNLEKKSADLHTMREMVDHAIEILNGDVDLTELGLLLHESWRLKKGLSERVSNIHIDAIYDKGRRSGAVGGKILGAGGGGFILFFVPPEKREQLKEALGKILYVPFRFDSLGSQIIYYSESGV